MLCVITKKADYMLRFCDRDGDILDSWKMDADLEDALWAACAEWCENYAYVTVADGDSLVCVMYDDGTIEFCGGASAVLD